MRGVEQLAKKAAAAAREGGRAEAGVVVQAATTPPRKYRGVKTLKSGQFAADIWNPVEQRRVRLGTFSSAEVAACAYDRAAREMQGRRAKPNFPEGSPPAAVTAALSAARRKGAGDARSRAPAEPAADQFSFKPASDPLPVPAYPFLHAPAPARARISHQPAPATTPEPAPPVIKFVRSIPPKSFSFQAAAAAARGPAHHTFQPVNFPGIPPIRIVSKEQMLASPADSCFSSTMEPWGASWSPRIAPSRRPVPKKPEVLGVPIPSVSTESVTEDTDDNFTDVASEWSCAASMPFSHGAL